MHVILKRYDSWIFVSFCSITCSLAREAALVGLVVDTGSMMVPMMFVDCLRLVHYRVLV